MLETAWEPYNGPFTGVLVKGNLTIPIRSLVSRILTKVGLKESRRGKVLLFRIRGNRHIYGYRVGYREDGKVLITIRRFTVPEFAVVDDRPDRTYFVIDIYNTEIPIAAPERTRRKKLKAGTPIIEPPRT